MVGYGDIEQRSFFAVFLGLLCFTVFRYASLYIVILIIMLSI